LRRAVFLDRDGTLNVRAAEHEYVTRVEEFEWLPGAREALAAFAGAGYALAVVSNQRGVARGLVAKQTLTRIEARIQSDLRAYGCSIDAFRYCVHDIGDACACRKPRPGMILDLAAEHAYDLRESWMVGDSESDVLAGSTAGCRTALIGDSGNADVIAPTLHDAASAMLELARSAQSAL
jgi:D-glycero-D-manno-heptose 1,7-bisphosphate phosphatase